MAVPFQTRRIVFLCALALAQAWGREVSVRLYANQGPERITLIQNGKSTPVEATTHPVLHISGPWRAQIQGQDQLKLPYPLEIRARAGRLELTVRLLLEEYVAATLAGESAGFRSDQSLWAMAVAARTYALRFQDRHRAEGFDFCDTTHCQDVRLSALSDRLRQAAEATEGELLWFHGSPAATFYSKDCGGKAEASAVVWPDMPAPYLGVREDSYCPRRAWKSSIRKEDLRAALSASGIRVSSHLDSVEVAGRTSSGRVLTLRTGSVMLSASSLRFAAGRALGWDRIPSDLYDLTDAGAQFVFEGRGAGHGVGLCQAGAARMGERGQSYRQILAYYYPGTSLGVTAQGFGWQLLGGERVQVISTQPHEDQPLVALADRLARVAGERSGLHWAERPKLRVYPTVATFRDATGEPGWVAASTRGSTIRLQPLATLRSRGSLDSAILHELLHALIESRARPGLPLWFREGAVEYLVAGAKPHGKGSMTPPEEGAFLGSAEEARRAYAAALDCFAGLVDQSGEATALGWIVRGLPAARPGSATK